jgi:hypothetical protein
MRLRQISDHSQLFGAMADGATGAAPAGQPTMIRTQGVPTGPGYKDRPRKWNAPVWFRVLKRVRHAAF